MVLNFLLRSWKKNGNVYEFLIVETEEKIYEFLTSEGKCHRQDDEFLIEYGTVLRLVVCHMLICILLFGLNALWSNEDFLGFGQEAHCVTYLSSINF